MQAVRGCPLVSTLQLEVADGSAMTINLNRLLGASKARPVHAPDRMWGDMSHGLGAVLLQLSRVI